jgi:hypothetical protein
LQFDHWRVDAILNTLLNMTNQAPLKRFSRLGPEGFPRFLRRLTARRSFRPTLSAQIDYAFLVPALRFLPPLD